MKYQTDHHFVIGTKHANSGKPCQDFALSGIRNDAAYAIVCDGCSSAGQTDVGARVLALQMTEGISFLYENNHYRISQIKSLLNLKSEDLLSTAMYAHIDKIGIYLTVFGDGVIARVYKDGLIAADRLEWSNNSPYYPLYPDKDKFLDWHKGDTFPFRITRAVIPPNGYTEEERFCYAAKEGVDGYHRYFDCNDISYIALFSDGITQINDVDWKVAIKNLLDIKNPVGEFVKRRMLRVLREMAQDGHYPFDDLACSIIYMENEDEI